MIERITIQDIEKVLAALKDGDVIVFPTETSYGIGCDATNEESVERLVEMKGRDRGKGLPLLIPSLESAGDYVALSVKARELVAKHWPGALNVIAPVAPGSPVAPSCAVGRTQSVRLSGHPFARELAERFGKPIVATSANISGAQPIYDPGDFDTMFDGAQGLPDLLVDGGALTNTAPSTTIKVIGDEVEVVRQGEIEI
ncbi:MAG: L-threonylcarbamoyladenylate synthase [Patescibacteria group bacterium]